MATTVRLTVRPAENYPVDLYYLMDMSNSMKDDLGKLTALATTIGTGKSIWQLDCTEAIIRHWDSYTAPGQLYCTGAVILHRGSYTAPGQLYCTGAVILHRGQLYCSGAVILH